MASPAFLIVWQLSVPAVLPAVGDAHVELVVTVPKNTAADAKVFLAGGLPELGNWRADGLRFSRQADGRYLAYLELPVGTVMEYKITRGSWEGVEKAAGGMEMGNRRLEISKSERIEISVAAWADGLPPSKMPQSNRAPGASTRTGDIRFHEGFASRILGNKRTIAVYLPPGYAKNKSQRYPVLYMHDGQNLFDAATSFIGVEWGVDETAERLISAKRIRPIIIVGVYNNAERMNEYTPTRDAGRSAGGKGDDYARFVIEEVKPFIDKTYRTRPGRADTAVAGSSLGGLISLHMATKHPDVFSMAGVLSPALMWDENRILKELAADPSSLRRLRVWLDMGTAEGTQISTFSKAVERTRELVGIMEKAGLVADRDYRYLEVGGGEHNEGAWAIRFDQVLEFFFSERNPASAAGR